MSENIKKVPVVTSSERLQEAHADKEKQLEELKLARIEALDSIINNSFLKDRKHAAKRLRRKLLRLKITGCTTHLDNIVAIEKHYPIELVEIVWKDGPTPIPNYIYTIISLIIGIIVIGLIIGL